jgi:hypothetical protein
MTEPMRIPANRKVVHMSDVAWEIAQHGDAYVRVGGGYGGRFALPSHQWLTLPGSLIQVRHELGHPGNCTLHDGALTLDFPEGHWSTRPLPPATPKHPDARQRAAGDGDA